MSEYYCKFFIIDIFVKVIHFIFLCSFLNSKSEELTDKILTFFSENETSVEFLILFYCEGLTEDKIKKTLQIAGEKGNIPAGIENEDKYFPNRCLLYTSPSPRDA